MPPLTSLDPGRLRLPEKPAVEGLEDKWTARWEADGVYRFWVQVRDANPASPDEGTEWWFSSVRTSAEWQRVALPFSRLRSIQRNSDGKLDPDKVRALVFIVDLGAMKAGSSGTLWIDDLGVY